MGYRTYLRPDIPLRTLPDSEDREAFTRWEKGQREGFSAKKRGVACLATSWRNCI